MRLMQLYPSMDKVRKIADNAYKQGKTDEQVKQLVSVFLIQSKKKLNPLNEDLV